MILSLAALLVLSGCVERYLRIETEPPGARLYINGEEAGVSPIERRFTYYGTVRVDAWIETATDKRPGVTRTFELVRPWYQYFPIDLFAELFDPTTHVDRHELKIEFPAATEASTTAHDEELRRRAEELRAETR